MGRPSTGTANGHGVVGREGSGRRCRFGDAGFEVGDPPVLEAQVRAGGLEPIVEGAVVGGEPAEERKLKDGRECSPASRAFGLLRAEGYDLVRRGEPPCRVLRRGRGTRVVTASLLRVLDQPLPRPARPALRRYAV